MMLPLTVVGAGGGSMAERVGERARVSFGSQSWVGCQLSNGVADCLGFGFGVPLLLRMIRL